MLGPSRRRFANINPILFNASWLVRAGQAPLSTPGEAEASAFYRF